MTTVHVRKRIPMSDDLERALEQHPEANSLMTELAELGIFVQIDEYDRLIWVATKGVPITIALLRAFKAQAAGLRAICEAGRLRRPPFGEAS